MWLIEKTWQASNARIYVEYVHVFVESLLIDTVRRLLAWSSVAVSNAIMYLQFKPRVSLWL